MSTSGSYFVAKSSQHRRRFFSRRVLGTSFIYALAGAVLAIGAVTNFAFAQVSIAPLGPTQQDEWVGYTSVPATAPQPVPLTALNDPIYLSVPTYQPSYAGVTEAERSIGLMPAAQFFGAPSPVTLASVPSPAVPAEVALQPAQGVQVGNEILTPPVVTRTETFTIEQPQTPLQQFGSSVGGAITRSREVVGRTANGRVAGFVGAGLKMGPDYLGADELAFSPVALGYVEVFDLISISHYEGVEIYVAPLENLEVALGLNWREGRDKPFDPNPLKQIDGGLTGGAEIAYSLAEVEIYTDVEKGLTGGNLGWEFDLGVRTKNIDLDNNVSIGGWAELGLADQAFMDAAFGVSKSESNATGLSTYDPTGGVSDITIGVDTFFYFTDHVGIYAGVQAGLLLEQAAASPIVRVEGSELQLESHLGLIFRF